MAARFPDLTLPIETIETQINKFCDRIITCVNARRMTLLATVQEKRNAKIESLRRRVEGRQQLEATKAEIERLMKENILQETQQLILREVERKLAEVSTPLPETRVVFRGEYGHLEQLIAALGEIREQEVPAVPRYEAMRPILAVGKTGKAPGELCCPRAVAIDRNTNNIYVTEADMFSDFPRISIFSDGGEFLNSYTHEHMKSPRGIAIHTDNMYITDTGVDAVFQFKIKSDIRLVAKFGTKGTGNGEFDLPVNLAVSTNGDVYVSDNSNNRVQILDSSLHYIRTLTEHSIRQPRDIKLTADSVYVLCTVSPCIRVFSLTGDTLRSLITQGDQLQVNSAWYFCLDSQENIIISDVSAHNIKVFSNEGNLICTIGGTGEGIGMFNYPRGVAINNLSLVVVSWDKNFGLRIFSVLQ